MCFAQNESPTLVLTDSVTDNTTTNSSVVNIAQNGGKVFLVYLGGSTPPPPPVLLPAPPNAEAQFFKNKQGTLVLKKTVNFDTTYTTSLTGGASPDFKRFVVIDQIINPVPPPFPATNNTVRVRVFNDDFDGAKTTIISNATIPTNPGEPVAFTEDGKFFATIMQVESEIFLRIFKAVNPKVFFDYDLGSANGTDAESVTYFRLKNKKGEIEEYFALGIATFSFGPPFQPPTSNLEIFKINRKGEKLNLELVSSTQLPQTVNAITGLRLPNNKLLPFGVIAVGTVRADLEGEIITYQVPQPSFIPDNGDELLWFQYDGIAGHEATLVASQNTKMDTNAMALNPADLGQTMATSVEVQADFPNPNFSPEFSFVNNVFHLRQITPVSNSGVAPLGIKEIDQMYAVGSEARTAQFSQNGKWLVVASCRGFQIAPADPSTVFLGETNNLQLFQVVK